ncbi:MAG: hypothetical protein WCI05_14705, partial [Myxococcales bacterium]
LIEGASAASSDGQLLQAWTARARSTAGRRTVHPFRSNLFDTVPGRSDELRQAWLALSSAAGDAVDWWPDEFPVVLGEVVGGENVAEDSGLKMESDRLFFRVVGATP